MYINEEWYLCIKHRIQLSNIENDWEYVTKKYKVNKDWLFEEEKDYIQIV